MICALSQRLITFQIIICKLHYKKPEDSCFLEYNFVYGIFQVFFERVFVTRPWKALFVTTDDDIHEWWFRWKLDRYR